MKSRGRILVGEACRLQQVKSEAGQSVVIIVNPICSLVRYWGTQLNVLRKPFAAVAFSLRLPPVIANVQSSGNQGSGPRAMLASAPALQR